MSAENTLPDWQQLQDDLFEWSEATFPKSSLHSRLEHLRRETLEIERNPKDILEFADVFMLLSHALRGEGFLMADLYKGVRQKLEICKARQWGKPDQHGVVEHVKTNYGFENTKIMDDM